MTGAGTRFNAPVGSAMTPTCTRCRPTQPLDALLPVFDRDEVAIVVDGEEFVGLITRIDLINHLRRATMTQHPATTGSPSPRAPSTPASATTRRPAR